jgi:hypothetical protein
MKERLTNKYFILYCILQTIKLTIKYMIFFKKQTTNHSLFNYGDFYKEIKIFTFSKFKFNFSIYKCTYTKPYLLTFYKLTTKTHT